MPNGKHHIVVKLAISLSVYPQKDMNQQQLYKLTYNSVTYTSPA